MQKRHFRALAESIALIIDEDARRKAAMAVCVACRKFNDLFDEKRFLRSCGVKL